MTTSKSNPFTTEISVEALAMRKPIVASWQRPVLTHKNRPSSKMNPNKNNCIQVDDDMSVSFEHLATIPRYARFIY
jgi:hypothetical protein